MNFQRYLIASLVFVLAYQAADLSWKLIAPESSVSAVLMAPSVVTSPAAPAAVGVNAEVDSIVAANLLGSVQAAPIRPAAVKAAPQAVKTRHAVKLIGIIHGSLPGRSVAILLSGNQQAAYVAGDALQLGRKSSLIEVQQDRVVIEVDGQLEYIELASDQLRQGQSKGQINRVRSRAENAQSLPARIDLKGAEMAAIVGDYRQKILTDPLSFSRFVQISPYVENNRVIGYRLNAGRDGRLFKTLGLQPGDLVTHINHIDISKPENISALIALVTAGGSVPVGVRRGDEQVDIDVEL